jgi:hypothetical protein
MFVSPARAALPEVPTLAESGFKDVEVNFWNGLFAPAKTPKDAVSRLAGWFTAEMQAPDLTRSSWPRGGLVLGVDRPSSYSLSEERPWTRKPSTPACASFSRSSA